MKTIANPSFSVRIHIAGDIDVARQWLRRECVREGLCVTLKAEEFIYTHGMEAGVEIGMENYPRFPKTADEILARAVIIAEGLMVELCQSSAMIVTPTEAIWKTTRDEK